MSNQGVKYSKAPLEIEKAFDGASVVEDFLPPGEQIKRKPKVQITIKMDIEVIDYFKDSAKETGIPYQKLINLYLVDCIKSNRKPVLQWA